MLLYPLPHSKLKDRLKELIQLCFIKHGRYKYLILGKNKSYFVKKLILTKCSLQLKSSTCLSFWLTTYLLCLVDRYFNSWYSHWYQLCFSSHGLVTLLQHVRLIFDFWCFNATFSNIMATSFGGGRSRSTRREPPAMGK